MRLKMCRRVRGPMGVVYIYILKSKCPRGEGKNIKKAVKGYVMGNITMTPTHLSLDVSSNVEYF